MKAKNPETIEVCFSNGQKIRADLETLKVFFDETGISYLEEAQKKRQTIRSSYAGFHRKNLQSSPFPVDPVLYPWGSKNMNPSPSLIYYKKDAVGVYPYGVPCLVYHQTSLDKKEYWALTLSSNYGFYFDTAEYDNQSKIEKIYEKFKNANPEDLAIEMFLSRPDSSRLSPVNVEKGFTENIEYAKNLLSALNSAPPVPLNISEALIKHNVASSRLSVLDPLLFRLVAIPGLIELSHSSSSLELDNIARQYGLVSIPGIVGKYLFPEGTTKFYTTRGYRKFFPKTPENPFHILERAPIGIPWNIQGVLSSQASYNKKNSAILNKEILKYEQWVQLRKKYGIT